MYRFFLDDVYIPDMECCNEDDGEGEHWQSVEDVEEPLVACDEAGVALDELDGSYDGSDEDEETVYEEVQVEGLPGGGLSWDVAWESEDSEVEDELVDDEEAEEGDLDEQACCDQVGARFLAVCAGHEATSGGLQEQTCDVAAYKDGGVESSGHDHDLLCEQEVCHSAEDHVDGPCVQCGGDQQEDGLFDVGPHGFLVVGGDASADVACEFDDAADDERDVRAGQLADVVLPDSRELLPGLGLDLGLPGGAEDDVYDGDGADGEEDGEEDGRAHSRAVPVELEVVVASGVCGAHAVV